MQELAAFTVTLSWKIDTFGSVRSDQNCCTLFYSILYTSTQVRSVAMPYIELAVTELVV
jgi:hypothetical protein